MPVEGNMHNLPTGNVDQLGMSAGVHWECALPHLAKQFRASKLQRYSIPKGAHTLLKYDL
jgi:hypothetical protein